MNLINNFDYPRIEVILVVPVGIEKGIFPWGVHAIRDYLANSFDSIEIRILNFSDGDYFNDLNERYAEVLSRLFFSMNSVERESIFGVTGNPYNLLGIASCTGDNLFQLTGRFKSFTRKNSSHLKALKEESAAHIKAKIFEHLKNSTVKSGSKRIWALSVYDRTLFNALWFAQLIKQEDPEASIIFGGDHFDFKNVEATARDISFVDGVILGYGEEVLCRLIKNKLKGIPVREQTIQGLINNRYFNSDDTAALKKVNVPPLYRKLSTDPVFTYVQQPKSNELRLLTQRGCSWGKCLFCAQLDKAMYYPASVDHVLEGIRHKIESANRGDQKDSAIKISFDSDENSPQMFSHVVNYLNGVKDSHVRFDVVLWLQVKSFRRELTEVIRKIDNNKINLLVKLNFESLNSDTLRNMRKGHSPLMCIEAAKAVQDCGHSFVTNYFLHFPLESSDSIDGEAIILRRVAHLFRPPQGKIILYPYNANYRDEVFLNQEYYNVCVERLKGDTWLKDVFGLDLPYSLWSYGYKVRFSLNPDRMLTYCYNRTLQARSAVSYPRRTATANWGSTAVPFGEKAAYVGRALKRAGWEFLYGILQLTKKGHKHRKRNGMFRYLSGLSAGNLTGCKGSRIYIEKKVLHKDFDIPGGREKWSRPLEDNELKILRFLYWTSSRKKVIEAFKDQISDADINSIIDRHLELGTLIEYRNLLLCIANDPDFLNS
jgi:hypothetical protein